ncbi:threonine dehydratase family protein [Tritrichomonas foetus]|uniref:Threonine dehydratase family protein n=1 Tax=Tritrichomonas foetus TaxID=1144522 RepID=A0A1J4KEV6_9EUKA|nr:threonine dehydratase family protein [Tritrichomonas foetus]|eukprot:OHT09967.1 threonine dehydratase family protein [Tritrichomonas foetus]
MANNAPPQSSSKYCINLDDVEDARNRIKDEAIVTPLIRFENLSKACDCDLYLKLENLQRCKAFKFRGALNKLRKLPKGTTVCAVSAGNHSQGVALASRLCGCEAVIFMPSNAMISKVQATQGYGGRVVQTGANFDEAKAAMQKALSENPDWVFVPPYEDEDIMAGQGTIGLEIIEQLPEVNTVVIPIGGGGLIGGVAYTLKQLNKDIRVIGVQMASCPVTYKNFYKHKGKEPKVFAREQKSPLADGIAVKSPGQKNLDIIYDLVDDIVIVNEDEVAMAIALMAERGKIIAEGAGAVAFAAILNKKFKYYNKEKIIGIVSGGNIPLPMLGRCIERALFLRESRVGLSVVTPYGSQHIRDMIDIIVNNKAEILNLVKEPQVDCIANKEHCSVVIDAPSPDSLIKIKQEFDLKGWSYTIENTVAIDE